MLIFSESLRIQIAIIYSPYSIEGENENVYIHKLTNRVKLCRRRKFFARILK